MIKIIAAAIIGVALAGAVSYTGSTLATTAADTTEPVNESLYNYGDR